MLGAGVMGAQIAAHLASAGLAVSLFELPAEDKDRNAGARAAVKALGRLKPVPLTEPGVASAIRCANYEDDLESLRDCDLVIEAIVERPELKHALYTRIAPCLSPKAVLVTNTSGIPIRTLSEGLPESLRRRFCGMHFFNPPRYMHLLELIPHEGVDAGVMDHLEGFATTVLGKGVVRARDTAGFVGNRVGVFAMLSVMRNAQRAGLDLDLVDKLTGSGIGRPKSATFRTADVVGLDVMAHVVGNLAATVADDPWVAHYRLPDWMTALVERGAAGQKSGAGVYRKQGRVIHVLDPETMEYRPVRSALDDTLREILKLRDPGAKYEALMVCDRPQAAFLRGSFLDLFHFCAWHLKDIAVCARDVDLAMRWGFGWTLGPFEIWQAVGWQRVVRDVTERIELGEAMSDVPLPDWVTDPDRTGVHDGDGSWSPAASAQVPRSPHPVYRRQEVPEIFLGEPKPHKASVYEDDAVHLWSAPGKLAVLEFRTRMHTIDAAVLSGVLRAVEIAEDGFSALVLLQPEAPFSAGANLKQIVGLLDDGRLDEIASLIDRIQAASMALKHTRVPTVAAVSGLALGGGCEFLLHCDRVVAALESYVGLVEVGVGLIPAGGGCKELALRAESDSRGGEVFPHVARYFELAAMAKVSSSAIEARNWGYLKPADAIVFHENELLHVARHQAAALFESGYVPPARRTDVRVAGAAGVANLKTRMVNLLRGGFISEHDYAIGSHLAQAICGGEVDPGARVSEAWLLRLERDAFMTLLQTGRTRDRIVHMLKHGKPLRN
ncbi:MAG: 3-hydroxyacyl-CoA dehydrogenase/enoyl-CoA hydratase family protein [Pseudomonadota bacterium]|nr:3-hydroxyacyl-CoA dehydrogenase/enoyl-CoA hydratase family protein [Pseudomonadota bacterium]